MQRLRLAEAKGVRRVYRFSGSVLQPLRLVKAEGSKEVSLVSWFSVADSETYKG